MWEGAGGAAGDVSYKDRKSLLCGLGCLAGGPFYRLRGRVPKPHTPDHTTRISGLNIRPPPQPAPLPQVGGLSAGRSAPVVGHLSRPVAALKLGR